MQRHVLTVFLLTFLFLISLFSGTAFSEDRTTLGGIPEIESSGNNRWLSWNRDGNHNGIDDVLDNMMGSESETQRTKIFVDYSSRPTKEDITRLSNFDVEVKYVYKIIDTVCVRNVLLTDIEKISKLPNVVMVEYEDDLIDHLDISTLAVKARASEDYSPHTVEDLGFLGRGINIAILDSGVDDGPSPAPPPYHSSLDDLDDDPQTDDPKFVAGVDTSHIGYIYDGTYNPDDSASIGHGTHVAGIAMGTGGGSEYIGVAPQARLVDVKVMERWGSGNMGEFIVGVEWCVEYKDEFDIRIMSMSVGGNYDSDGSDAGSQAINAAWDEGIICVTSIGNGGTNTIGPPASADNVITVGAIDDQGTITRADDQIWDSSNYGPRQSDDDSDDMDELKPDVVAPGVNIMSAKSNTIGTYIEYDGTSMACPHVSGVIALMLEANPDLSPDQVREILRSTAEMPEGVDPYNPDLDPTYNEQWGWGMIDAYKAVAKALEFDDRPPIISDIDTHISGTTATINWRTHKKANSIIEYGKSQNQLDETVSDTINYTIIHNMTLRNLDADTDYYFKIKGYDEQGIGPGESSVLSFHTEEVNDTTPPEISIPILLGKSDTTATIIWETNEPSDSGVEYGLSTEYGNIERDIKQIWIHSVTLFYLEPETTYHFRINSSDASGNYNYSDDYIFTTDSSPDETPPTISNIKVKDITEDSATIVWDTNEPSNVILRYNEKYDESLDLWNDIPLIEYYWKKHTIKLTGLESYTVYYFKLTCADPSGNTVVEGDETYQLNTSGPPDNTPPKIVEGPKITVLTDSTATIEWVTDEESDSAVDYGVEPGEYWSPVKSKDYVLVHNITLTDLDDETTYYYRVRSKDKSPNHNENISKEYSFTTKPPIDNKPPKILTGPNLLEVGEDTATIIWTTNEASDSQVQFGTTTDYGQIANDTSLIFEHMIILTDLIPSTTYHYKVNSKDASANLVESGDYTFTTLEITIPIEIEFLNLQDGQKLSGVINIEGRVSGGTGSIEWVKYKVDNETWQNLGQGSTFSIVLDANKYSEGEHTLYVQARVGVMTMQEDITFIVEHKNGAIDEALFFWVLLIIITAIIILAVVFVVYNSKARNRVEKKEASFAAYEAVELPLYEDTTQFQDLKELQFLPDEESLTFEETKEEISFIPEPTTISQEPEISFVPDREPVSFNVFEEAPRFAVYDTVRCPKCKNLFNADISSKIVCPDCGFSADLRK